MLLTGCRQRPLGTMAIAADADKVAAQGFEGVALLVDLRLRAKAEAAHDGHRRAPALNRVLQQKTRHDRRKKEKLPAHRRPQRQADKRSDSRVLRPETSDLD